MSLEHLWAAWRADYVASVVSSDHADDAERLNGVDESTASSEKLCVFCTILDGSASDEERLIVHRGTNCAALLNAYPYSSGHLLILPLRHVDDLGGLTPEESAELWQMTCKAVAAQKIAYGADGLNVGANLGRAAGAGIPAHLHFHVLPRWVGDTNFMTTIAGTRVLPEALSASWKKLTLAWPS